MSDSIDYFNRHRDPAGELSWTARNFPEIRTLSIEVRRAEGTWEKDASVQHYDHRTYRGEPVRCGNWQCYGGFFDVSWTVREMVRQRLTQRTLVEGCGGHEGSPKGKVLRRRCRYKFITTIQIEFESPEISGGP
jgi:hypothetical protein